MTGPIKYIQYFDESHKGMREIASSLSWADVYMTIVRIPMLYATARFRFLDASVKPVDVPGNEKGMGAEDAREIFYKLKEKQNEKRV